MREEKYSIKQLVEGVREKDNTILEYIYKSYYPYIEAFILHNNGDEDDAKDVFQEAIITIYKYASDESFKIEQSFRAYLYTISKHYWLNQLRSREIHDRKMRELEKTDEPETPLEEHVEEEMEMRIYRKHFMDLDEECRKILELTNNKIPYDKIARDQGYKNERYVRNKRFRCKEYLINKIKEDPEYIKFMKMKGK